MKRENQKYKNRYDEPAPKQDGELENLLKITEDDELKKLLGLNNVSYEKNYQDANIQNLRAVWKKEKNRIAAKKSREKKANLMMELEKKEVQLSNEVDALKRLLMEYDNILESLLRYIKFSISGTIPLVDWAHGGYENIINTPGSFINGKPKLRELTDKDREAYKKLVCCLEYFYHIRNNDSYGLPYMHTAMGPRQDSSNRLIDEIIYSIKTANSCNEKK